MAAKKLAHSFAVKSSMRRPMAFQRPSIVRFAASHKSALSLVKAFSIGLSRGCRAGEKGAARRRLRFLRTKAAAYDGAIASLG